MLRVWWWSLSPGVNKAWISCMCSVTSPNNTSDLEGKIAMYTYFCIANAGSRNDLSLRLECSPIAATRCVCVCGGWRGERVRLLQVRGFGSPLNIWWCHMMDVQAGVKSLSLSLSLSFFITALWSTPLQQLLRTVSHKFP